MNLKLDLPKLFFLMAAMCFQIGCSGSGQPDYEMKSVSGTITFEGQPVENASVVFDAPSGARAFGLTDSMGQFQLETHRYGKGAPAGEYLVKVLSKEGTKVKDSSQPLEISMLYQENGVAKVVVTDESESRFTFDLKKSPDEDDVISSMSGEG
ncbi:hypothetical protein Pan54_03550 [Rubinisphaera italica]|uniref:Carboxypeptidase regulatory-like domain-containing protein n=2 Tax=Rubinisphaera italica TaxID=2527969 RepID=A0A5C5X936_9PLAN|nr:hypothetical protein Pan54_03550 [Rubinisphaera italica]